MSKWVLQAMLIAFGSIAVLAFMVAILQLRDESLQKARDSRIKCFKETRSAKCWEK